VRIYIAKASLVVRRIEEQRKADRPVVVTTDLEAVLTPAFPTSARDAPS
jgi:hypothetical protein